MIVGFIVGYVMTMSLFCWTSCMCNKRCTIDAVRSDEEQLKALAEMKKH